MTTESGTGATVVAAAEPETSTEIGAANLSTTDDELIPLPEPDVTADSDAEAENTVAEDEPQAGAVADAEAATERGGFFRNLFRRSKPETAEPASTDADTIAMAQEPDSPLDAEDEPASSTLTAPGPGSMATTVSDPAALDAARTAYNNKAYEEAYVLYRPLAVQGDPLAQYQLASMYHQGLGVQQNYTDALYWYQQAAEQGNVDAQYSLGNMYLMGEGVPQDDAQAADWYGKAAAQGHDSARHNLANIQKVAEAVSDDVGQIVPGELPADSEGYQKPAEEKKARFSFIKDIFSKKQKEEAAATPEPAATPTPEPEPAAEAPATAVESADATTTEPATEKKGFLGRIFGKDEDQQETTATAIPETAPATAVESADATATEPVTEKKGFFSRIFNKDKKTETATTAAAEEQQTVSPEVAKQVEEFIDYENSKTETTTTESTAKTDYEKGLAYQYGEGVAVDGAAAFQLYMRAAEQGYAPAQYKVGTAYAYGEGVTRNETEAASWYNRAARQGHAIAQRNLGVMYLNGEGVEQNKSIAMAWYSVLADHGNVMDIRRRDMLENELSSQEKQAATQLKAELITEINN